MPEPEAALVVGGKRSGEITSMVDSPRVGRIALGFVRREHSEPGTWVDAGGVEGVVQPLPFVAPATAGGEPSD